MAAAHFTLRDVKLFTTFIAAIEALTEEACFEVSPEGLRFRGMDASHVAMIDLFIPKSAFEEFSCEEPVKFCVETEQLLEALKGTSKSATATVKVEGGFVTIESRGRYFKTDQIPLIETAYERPPQLRIQFESGFRIKTSALEEVFSDAKKISDVVTVTTSEDGTVEFSAKSDVGRQFKVQFKRGDIDLLDVKPKASKATYNVEILSKIVKTVGKEVDEVNFEFGTDIPCVVKARFPDTGEEFNLYLAPRLE